MQTLVKTSFSYLWTPQNMYFKDISLYFFPWTMVFKNFAWPCKNRLCVNSQNNSKDFAAFYIKSVFLLYFIFMFCIYFCGVLTLCLTLDYKDIQCLMPHSNLLWKADEYLCHFMRLFWVFIICFFLINVFPFWSKSHQ